MQQNITVVGPDEVMWQEYRNLRVLALRLEPQLFISTYRKEKSHPDQKWVSRLDRYRRGTDSYMVFAKFGQRVIGMLGAYQSERDVKQKIVNLEAAYVGREFRGRGITSLMLEAVLTWAKSKRKAKKIRVSINPLQEHEFELYASYGFTVVSKQEKTYGDNLIYEEHIMEKELN